MIVGVDELSNFFGVHKTTIYSWMKLGCPVHERGGTGRAKAHKLSTVDVSNWLQNRAVEEATGSTDHMGADEAKRRKLSADAGLAEIELAKAKKIVADLTEVEREISTKFAEVSSSIRRVPERCALRLMAETDETKIKKIILDEIDQCLESLTYD